MKQIITYPEIEQAHRDGRDRGDNAPEIDLFECYDLWASGAWPDSNALPNLEEVMGHIALLLGLPDADEQAGVPTSLVVRHNDDGTTSTRI